MPKNTKIIAAICFITNHLTVFEKYCSSTVMCEPDVKIARSVNCPKY